MNSARWAGLIKVKKNQFSREVTAGEPLYKKKYAFIH